MRHIYTTGKQIPHEQRYSIARAMTEQEQANADYVLAAHYKRDGDFWYNQKCDVTMAEAEEKHQKRVNAGKQGGKAKAARSSNAKAMPEQSSSNQNHNQNHIGTKVPIHTEDGDHPPDTPETVLWDMPFQQIWHVYPAIGKGGLISAGLKGSKKHAQTAFFKLVSKTKEADREDLFRNILNACHGYAQFLKFSGQPCKHLATWINANGWEDDYTIQRQADDPLQRGAAKGQGTGYVDSVFDAAGKAIEDLGHQEFGTA
ncbi:hypothetical protein GCM10027347_59760 [Larkinella harenae]